MDKKFKKEEENYIKLSEIAVSESESEEEKNQSEVKEDKKEEKEVSKKKYNWEEADILGFDNNTSMNYAYTEGGRREGSNGEEEENFTDRYKSKDIFSGIELERVRDVDKSKWRSKSNRKLKKRKSRQERNVTAFDLEKKISSKNKSDF